VNRFPILNTKLYKPKVKAHYVFRKEIVENLERHRDKPLTLVVAATGYGKSVTISEWLDYSKAKYCWISLDEEFNDLRTFLSYVIYAVRSVFPESLHELNEIFEGLELPPEKTIVNSLINELDDLEEELILVLDDYHLVKDQKIHNMINELLKYLPRDFHLVIISRGDPPLNLSSLKTFGRVNEIRMAELSFDQNEIFKLAKILIGNEVSKETIMKLLEKTEGWVVGLRLALLTMTEEKDLEKTFKEIKGDKHFYTQYLMDEVFLHQEKDVQEILLIASCFERFSKELLKFVVGEQFKNTKNEYHTVIDNLFDRFKTASLFIIPLDDTYEWFRFHHFFGNFLSIQLANRTSSEKIKEYHKHGSEYFYSNNLFEEAIYQSVKSDNIKLIVKIFEQNKYKLLSQDKFNLLSKWLSIIPEEIITKELHLLLTRAVLHDTKANFIAMQNDMVVAWKLLEESTNTTKQKKQLLAEYHAVHCGLSYVSGNIQESIDHYENAFKLISKNQFYFIDIALSYGAFAINASCRPDEATNSVINYLNDLPASYTFSRMRGMVILSMVYSFHGDLRKIIKLSHQVQPVFQKNNLWVSFSYATYFLSEINYQWNELDNVIKYVDQVEEHKYAGRPHWILNCLYTKAFTLLAKGNFEELELTILKLNTIAKDYGLGPFYMIVKACEVELALRQNKIEKALKISKGINFEVHPPVYYSFIPQLTFIKLLLSTNDIIRIDEAADRLEELIDFGRKTFRQNLLIQALSLQSLICIKRGDEEKANILIEEALTIAEPGGFIRTFIDLGKPMEKLLMSVYKINPDNIYLNRILREFKKEKQNISPQVIIDEKTSLSENLSAREIELLDLVAKGLRNREIADKLNLSTISIKKYLSNIYLKLNVGNRVLAISKAREFGLISTI